MPPHPSSDAPLSDDTGPDLIAVERTGHVTIIRMNRPHKYNAITQDMYAALAEALLAADRDTEVRAVILTGSGAAFSAGNDLHDFALDPDGLAPVQQFLRAIAGIAVPLIAAVNGLAVGVGVTMLLHCDLVYADPAATFQTPFVDIGLVPEAASTLLLPQLIGARRAADMLLGGRKLTADEAAAWGLINEVSAAPLEKAITVGTALAAKAPGAARNTKTLSRSTNRAVLTRMREEETAMAAQLESAEFTEVLAARRDKRPPVFPPRPTTP
ncbi:MULTISPECIES: enoyl-CoA hydratase-related protein [Mycobacteriaceae]|uniref:Enoyl-CoA hydratase n=1 Tax=Mycolicibacterium murale TaxID=182220 RepID=A0A7I9WGT5_9MYCO|nr:MULTISPECIES: enoyl-CoA hydratase-related protein [Mycobacteriaceae]MCV7182967.1 enoyl-CoA hydratase/isomerase family protein [Mycolicibacterium murale]GFG56520.1 enoyl-CoA hydratase [Mycolicibacterium murale]